MNKWSSRIPVLIFLLLGAMGEVAPKSYLAVSHHPRTSVSQAQFRPFAALAGWFRGNRDDDGPSPRRPPGRGSRDPQNNIRTRNDNTRGRSVRNQRDEEEEDDEDENEEEDEDFDRDRRSRSEDEDDAHDSRSPRQSQGRPRFFQRRNRRPTLKDEVVEPENKAPRRKRSRRDSSLDFLPFPSKGPLAFRKDQDPALPFKRQIARRDRDDDDEDDENEEEDYRPKKRRTTRRQVPRTKQKSYNRPVEVNDANFKKEVLDEKGMVLVDFYGSTCPPCQALAPYIEKLAERYAGKIKVVKINTDRNQQYMREYGISAVPTLMVFKDGDRKQTQNCTGPQLEGLIAPYL